jgi:hypothetical protein
VLPAEKLRIGILAAFVLFVYAAALGFGVHAIVRRGVRRGRRMWWARTVVAGLAVLGVACFLYARFIEPTWLDVTHTQIATAKLAAGARPIRIVHISDVHSDPEVRLEERLPDVIAAEHPDLIVFTGDSLNTPEGLPHLRGTSTSAGSASRIAGPISPSRPGAHSGTATAALSPVRRPDAQVLRYRAARVRVSRAVATCPRHLWR